MIVTLPEMGESEGDSKSCQSTKVYRNTYVPPSKVPTNVTAAAVKLSLPKIDKNTNTKLDAKSSTFAAIADNSMEIFGGIVTWMLLTMTNENQNEGGYLLSSPRGAGDRSGAAKREIWCVLVDKVFFNFAPDSVKARCHADLKHCHVTPVEGGLFRIDSSNSAAYSFKTLYFTGKNKEESARWFWKLYTQSASNNVQKYTNLNFQPGSPAAPFVIIRTADGENNPFKGQKDRISSHRPHRISPLLAAYRSDPMLDFLFVVEKKVEVKIKFSAADSIASISSDERDSTGPKKRTLTEALSKNKSILATTLESIIRQSSLLKARQMKIENRVNGNGHSECVVGIVDVRTVSPGVSGGGGGDREGGSKGDRVTSASSVRRCTDRVKDVHADTHTGTHILVHTVNHAADQILTECDTLTATKMNSEDVETEKEKEMEKEREIEKEKEREKEVNEELSKLEKKRFLRKHGNEVRSLGRSRLVGVRCTE